MSTAGSDGDEASGSKIRLLSKTPPRSFGWAPTRWSVVSNLEDRADPKWETSWSVLADGYRRPMELYARRLLSRTPGGAVSAQDATDLVQDFLTTCLEKDWLSRADPDRGKFRAFVQVLLKRYVTRWVRRRLAKKRRPGEGQQVVPLLPDDEAHVVSDFSADDAADFDHSWTDAAIERALARLQEENERYHLVIRDLIDTDGEGSEDIAERVGLRPKQFPVLRHRARRRFGDLFEQELRATVRDPSAFDEEWRALTPYMP